MQKTIDTPNARRVMEAGGLRGAAVIGQPGGWAVMLKIGTQETPLGTQRTDKPRVWASLDTCIQYLRDELGIVRIDGIDARNYSAASVHRPRRPDAAAQMRRAHEAAAHDAWFRAQVQASIDDPRPSVPDDQARATFASRKSAIKQAAR